MNGFRTGLPRALVAWVVLQALIGHSAFETLAADLPPEQGIAVDRDGTGNRPDQSLRTQNGTDLLDLDIEELGNVPVNVLVTTEVTGASKTPERAFEVPATVHLVTKEDIRQRGYSNLRDVLRDVPGMETIDFYFSEFGTLVPVRGVVGNNKIVFLLNGMRVNPPGGEEMMLRSDFSVRMAERIEIIYGPGSTMYGQDAISAIVNVITASSDFGQGVANFGMNEFREGFLGISREIGGPSDNRIRFSASFQGTYCGLTDLAQEYPDWWASYGAASFNAPASPVRSDEGYNILARLENSNSSFQMWYRNSSRSSSEGGYHGILYFVDQAIWQDESFVMEGKNRYEISDKTDLVSRITFNRYEIDPRSRYVWPSSPSQLFFDDFKYGVGTRLSLEEMMEFEVSERFQIIAGFQASFFDIIPKATIPGSARPNESIVQQGGVFQYYTNLGDPSSLVEVPRATNLAYQNFGYYLQGRFRILDGLDVVAGARIDDNTRYDEVPVSPRASVIYSDSEQNFTLKYMYSQAFVGPPPYYAHNVFDNGVALNRANLQLQPETASSHEINFTHYTERLLCGTSVYFNTQQNLFQVGDLLLPANIVQDVVYLDLAGTDTRILTQTANGGTSRAVGCDVYSRYRHEGLSYWASYSFVDFKSVIDGVRSGLPLISAHNLRLGLSWQVLGELTITPSLVYRSRPEGAGNVSVLMQEIDDPYEINLQILYAPRDDLDVFIDFRNLTDHKYALKGILAPTPQETFRVNAGIRYLF